MSGTKSVQLVARVKYHQAVLSEEYLFIRLK